MTTAYSYIRFSHPDQAKGNSLKRQTQQAEDYATKHDLTLSADSYRDLGVSAHKGKNASKGELSIFLDLVNQGKIKPGSVLLLENLDRLSRQPVGDTLSLFLGILSAGIKIVCFLPFPQEYTTANINKIETIIIAIITMQRAWEESAMKAARSIDNWQQKRDNIGSEKLTGRIPGWLTLDDDKKTFSVKAAKAETVKDIFQAIIDGQGIFDLSQEYNSTGKATVGKSHKWFPSYIHRILNNRATFGEFQPHHLVDGVRKPIGKPVENYYPPIITEEIYYQAQKALASRLTQKGPRGEKISNLFTGLMREAKDKSTMGYINKHKGKGRKPWIYLVSSAAVRGEPGSEYQSFPYEVWERAFLLLIEGLSPSEVFPKSEAKVDPSAALEAKISTLAANIQTLQDDMMKQGDISSLIEVLRRKESQKKQAEEQLSQFKAEANGSQGDTLADCQTLINTLKTTKDLLATRQRIKAKIRQLVKNIWSLLWTDKEGTKRALFQVCFHSGKAQCLLFARVGKTYTASATGLHSPITTDEAKLLKQAFPTAEPFEDLGTDWQKAKEWYSQVMTQQKLKIITK